MGSVDYLQFRATNPFTSKEEIRRLRGEAYTKVHLELGEEDPKTGSWTATDFDCKGIIIVLLIKELLFLSQMMVSYMLLLICVLTF
jgi:hypothetical protein